LPHRTVKQRLAINELWQRNQIALLRDSQTMNTTRKEPNVTDTPMNPEQEAQALIAGINKIEDQWMDGGSLTTPTRREVRGQVGLPESITGKPAEKTTAQQLVEAEAKVAELREQIRKDDAE
jgi:hypothetical protein